MAADAPPSPALSALEAQLYDEGKTLWSSLLTTGLHHSLVGAAIAGDGGLAAAMRLKFFGELDLLTTPRATEPEGSSTRHDPASAAAEAGGQNASEPGQQPSRPGSGASGVSELMRESATLMGSLEKTTLAVRDEVPLPALVGANTSVDPTLEEGKSSKQLTLLLNADAPPTGYGDAPILPFFDVTAPDRKSVV